MYSVLVAENEPWVLRGIVDMVEAVGDEFEVVGACGNGEEAWSLIHESWPMLLITDIMMPRLDGLSLVKRLAEQGTSVVSIIISGYDNFQYAQKAITYGVSEYLLKPVEFDVLAEALNRSKEKLESLKGLNEYVLKFQALLDNRQELPPKMAMLKQADLLQSVLRMKMTRNSSRTHLLRIFDNKLRMLLEGCGIAPPEASLYKSDDDQAIMRHYADMLEKWYLAGATLAKSAVPDAIERICRYIRDHFKEDLTLSEMAEQTNFSVSHFSTLFKKHTGSSFVSYVNGLKVDEAKQLLRSTAYSVSEITEIVGFSTTPYFSRVFKSTAGLTPLEYRKKMGS